MWGKDNEVRDLLKKALQELDAIDNTAGLAAYGKGALTPPLEEVLGMIFKEENILFPTSLEKLDASDWVDILRESEDIGYVFIRKPEETIVLEKHLQNALFEFLYENKTSVKDTIKAMQQLGIEINMEAADLEKEVIKVG
jgi:DUF438 domain-containing protein